MLDTRYEVASSPARQKGPAEHSRMFVVALFLGLGLLWVLPISSSFWVDETGTFVAARGSWRAVVRSALEGQGQVPYLMLAWLVRSIGGANEVALRLPSLLALGLGTFLLYRLGRRLFDRETGLLAVVAFASVPVVAFMAVDARPYALSLTLLIGSALALVRWLDDGKLGDAFLSAICGALAVSTHYLFSVALIPQFLYALQRLPKGQRRPSRALAPLVLLVILLVPLGFHALSIFSRRETMAFPINLDISELVRYLAPPTLMVGITAALLVAAASRQRPVTLTRLSGREAATTLVVAWAIVPPVLMYTLSHLTSASFFTDRYVASSTPGLALLAGRLLANIGSAIARKVGAAVLVAVSLVTHGTLTHGQEDWRAAAHYVSQVATTDTAVLLHAAFVESAQPDWLRDPLKADFLNAPAAMYPMRGRVYPMPYVLDDFGEDYLEQLVRTTLLKTRQFILVTRFPTIPFREWLLGRLEPQGFLAGEARAFGRVWVTVFERDRPTLPP